MSSNGQSPSAHGVRQPKSSAMTAPEPQPATRTEGCRAPLQAATLAHASCNNTSTATPTCPNCRTLVGLLKKVKVDYDFNLSLIADRDAELKRWEDRDAWWRKRWKESCLEKDQMATLLKAAQGQLASMRAPTTDDDGLAMNEPGDRCDSNEAVQASHENDLATIESLRAAVRDLQAQLTAQTRRADASNQSLATLTSSQRILESRLRETDRSLHQAQAKATAAQSALAEAQAAETRVRAERDALHGQLAQAYRDRDQAIATTKSMAKDLKRLAHRVTELAAVGEHADTENAKLNEEAAVLQAEKDRMQALVDATKETAGKEVNRLREEVARVREEHVQDRLAWMQESREREKVLAMAEARVQMQAEELARSRDQRGGYSQEQQWQPHHQHHQADRELEHGEHATMVDELEAENAQLADVIRAMREEMERVANAHRWELDGLTERARAAESRCQEAEQRVEERERALVEKNRELEKLAEKVRLATASGPPLPSWPVVIPSGTTSMPLWNPQVGQWVIIPQQPQSPPDHPIQNSASHYHASQPPAPSAPPAIPPTAPNLDQANALDTMRAGLQTQLDHHRSQLLEALADRERLINESNRLHAELRRLRSQLARVPQPPLRVETQVQTDPILIASMGPLEPPALDAVATGGASKAKRRTTGSMALTGLTNSASSVKAKDGVLAGSARPQRQQAQSQQTNGKRLVSEESKREALLRLRKMGLRNWNDNRDDD